jgi:hypothetical protein
MSYAGLFGSDTIEDDGRIDIVSGQGGQDWYVTGSRDRINDKERNEIVR